MTSEIVSNRQPVTGPAREVIRRRLAALYPWSNTLLRPRWRKVLRDLWLNKTRAILVVLSIAVGVFAVGMIATSRLILAQDLTNSYLATNPASAMLAVSNPVFGGDIGFDDDLVESVRRMRQVREAEGRRVLGVRIQVGPGDWRDLQLIAIPDYDNIPINKVVSESGAWPPGEDELLIERSGLGLTGVRVGDTVLIKTPAGKERKLRVAGLTQDLSRLPSFIEGWVYGYVTFDTLEWLGEERDYNELYITVADKAQDKGHIQAVAEQVRDKVEQSGRTVLVTLVPDPGEHPLNDTIQTLVLLLGVLGLLALLMSGFLVVNTISALLAQQTRQIGVMKAIGARSGQIITMYLTMVLILGLLALVVAVPLGAAGAWGLTRYIATLFSFDLSGFSLPPQVLALQATVALLVPLLAALYPVMVGLRLTAAQAMSSYGLGKGGFGRNLVGRFTVEGRRVLPIPRPYLLSFRNTFRRKGRLALTLITLTLAGAIFMTVFCLRSSLLLTLDSLLETWQWDVWVTLARPYRVERLEREALVVPGVASARGIGFTVARRLRADDSEGENIFLFAPPAGSALVQPGLLEGRWLMPQDDRAVVVTTDFLKKEPDVQVGQEVVLKLKGRETTWRVVGLTRGLLLPMVYTNYSSFSHATHENGHASCLWLVTERAPDQSRYDSAFQTEVTRALEAHFERIGLEISSITRMAEERAENEAIFNIVINLLAVMAVLLALVGGLGLMGMMSISVLERTREIGVMRAIGGSDGAVRRVFIVEGVIIGLISWLLGVVIALPLSQLLSRAVGLALLQTPLVYTFSLEGMLLWLALVVLLSALASFLPAWNASRLTVREVLAYE